MADLPKNKLRQQTKVKTKRRRRRSTDEILDLLLEAACDEFERNGYERAKTAAIARKAGVTEALIFSNFGSKARLFHDSIFKPLDRHFNHFHGTHLVEAGDTEGLREGTRQYILELQQFIARHSRMLRSVVAAQLYTNGDVRGVSEIEGLHNFLSRAAEVAMKRHREKPKIDPRLLARVSFAAILACIIFKDWLFPKGLASDEDITAAISDFVMEGLDANVAPAPETRRASRSRASSAVARPPKKGSRRTLKPRRA